MNNTHSAGKMGVTMGTKGIYSSAGSWASPGELPRLNIELTSTIATVLQEKPAVSKMRSEATVEERTLYFKIDGLQS